MKVAAIYNVFDGVELLRGSMQSIKNGVDLFVITYQDISNFGEQFNPIPLMDLKGFNYVLVKFTPEHLGGQSNESKKRQMGLEIAKIKGCTHFLFVDCDEYYNDFQQAKKAFIDSGADGSVCPILTYFKKPTLRFKNIDNYYVPFIHKLNGDTITGNRNYPHYSDRTRQTNHENVVILDERMHHFSWVRNDIMLKVRNSSAKQNIKRSELLNNYLSDETGAGSFIKDYQQELIEVPNRFNITV